MPRRKANRERMRRERLEREEAAAQRRSRERRIKAGVGGALALAIAGLIGLAVVAGGSGGPPSSPPPQLSRAQLAELPDQLAANLRQGNQVIDGSIEEKLVALRGVPVVVNQWASWCTTCRAEFPFFQRLSDRLRDRVAFLGLDSQDSRGGAKDFLEQYPVNYPSIFDESAAQAASIGGGQGWPTTIFFNRAGERTFIRPGGYPTAALLREDIERYALERPG